jgi:hypothetical protein
MLAVAAPFFVPAAYGLAALVGIYALCILAAAVMTGIRQGIGPVPVLPIVFATYHFAYGLGFLSGFWDLIVMRRTRPFAKRLTRTSGPASSQ